MKLEVEDRAVGDNFVNCNFGRRSAKSFAGTEGWNGNMQPFGADATDALGEQSEVSTANRESADGDQRSGCDWVMVENETFHDATREREVSPVKAADLNLTVASLTEVLKYLGLREGPQAARHEYDRQ